MPRTLLNPSVQISSSTVYTSNAPQGITLQTGALTLEQDLNGLRAQVSAIIDASQAGNWYDPIPTVAGKKRSVLQLSSGLSTLENKSMLRRVSVQAQIAVPAGQNYVLLTVAGQQAPTAPAAFGANTMGTVVAQSAASGAPFLANELTIIAGSNPQTPKNGAIVIDSVTRQQMQTNAGVNAAGNPYDIIGLLQTESTATDGQTFSDTSATSRVKMSFVYFNPASNSLVAAAPADVGGKTISYAYAQRYTFADLSDDAFIGQAGYTDATGDVDITASRAFMNQAGAAIPINANAQFRVANSVNFAVQNGTGSTNLFGISPSASGNAANINTDTFAITTTAVVTSTKGISAGTAAQAINVGSTAGQIDSNGALALRSLGANGLTLAGGSTMTLTDGFEAASTWTSPGVALSANTSEWSAYKAAYGEASLMSSILKAGQMGSHGIYTAVVTAATIPAGTTVTGAGGSANLSAAFPDTTGTPRPNSNIKILLNGVQMTMGDDFALVSPSTSTALTFTFALRGGATPDRVTLETFQNPANMGS